MAGNGELDAVAAICYEGYFHLEGILPIVNMAGGKVITVIDRRPRTYDESDDHGSCDASGATTSQQLLYDVWVVQRKIPFCSPKVAWSIHRGRQKNHRLRRYIADIIYLAATQGLGTIPGVTLKTHL
jgi:hypothetical protein